MKCRCIKTMLIASVVIGQQSLAMFSVEKNLAIYIAGQEPGSPIGNPIEIELEMATSPFGQDNAQRLYMTTQQCISLLADQLCDAVGINDKQQVGFLIKNNSENIKNAINNGDEDGVTALHCAAFVGSKEIIKLLLATGADNRLVDDDGDTALAYFKQGGFHDQDVEAWLAASPEELKKMLKID